MSAWDVKDKETENMSVLVASYPCAQMALFGLTSPLSRYKTVTIVVLLYNILVSSKVDSFL